MGSSYFVGPKAYVVKITTIIKKNSGEFGPGIIYIQVLSESVCEAGSCAAQAGLRLLGSSGLLIITSQVAGTTGV